MRSRKNTNWVHVRSCAIPGVEDMGWHRRLKARQVPLQEHVHGAARLEIVYLKTGRQTFTVNGKADTLIGGDARIVFPNDRHGISGVAEDRHLLFFLVLRLDTPMLLNLAPPMDGHLRSLLMGLRGRKFRAPSAFDRLFSAAIAELDRTSKQPAATLRAQMHILTILMETVRCAGTSGRRVNLYGVTRAIRAIRENPERRWSLSPLVRLSKMSPATFRRHFLEQTGGPPRDFVQRCRIERAKEQLLAQPDRKTTDLAFDLGFSSSQHFATVFRRFTGVSPREFKGER